MIGDFALFITKQMFTNAFCNIAIEDITRDIIHSKFSSMKIEDKDEETCDNLYKAYQVYNWYLDILDIDKKIRSMKVSVESKKKMKRLITLANKIDDDIMMNIEEYHIKMPKVEKSSVLRDLQEYVDKL